MKRFGKVALLGKTNAGKSSFLNALIEEKVSIVSDKTQTTQDVVRGIYTIEDSQIVFLDTPGIYRGKKMSKSYERATIGAIQEADIILHLVDSSKPQGEEEQETKKILDFFPTKTVLEVYTKIDKKIREVPEGVFGISCIDQKGFKELMLKILSILPEGEWQYPDDMYTDQDPYYRVKEIVREKVLFYLQKELPYAVKVDIQDIKQDEGILRIYGYLCVGTMSQKKIVIGDRASTLVKIGTLARQDLEKIFEQKVYLSLRVRIDAK